MKFEAKHEELLKDDDKYVWHSMKPYNPDNTIIVKKGDGAWITDSEGKRYLDGMSGLWCVNVGYGRTELAKVAYEQLNDFAYYPLTQSHEPAIKLSKKLNGILGDEYVIFFSNSGTEANEVAFKIARQYHEQNGNYHRYKIISRYRSYHGNSIGTLSATGQAQRKYKYEPLASGFLHVPPPDTYRKPEDHDCNPRELESVQVIDQMMTWELKDTIAAVIMEPIITGGGVIMPPNNYMKGVKAVCEEHGALLIVDEVICGFGRTGEAFGFMNYGVEPDIITMAKGLTSAYLPLSATAVKREIYDAFKGSEDYDFFRHINTFGGSPTSCALALKNLEILETEKLYERSKSIGKKIIGKFRDQLKNHSYVGDIRGKGLLIGIELVENKETKAPLDVKLVNKVIVTCKEKGLIIGKNGVTVAGYNNVITLAPPLIITKDDMSFIIKTIVEALNKLN
ncbi:aspartate aminotransferase family protein [Evansella sp. AB-P1]|uniref:aspartate aminotransferase family protein n=1 Tax=Evansella sp. AB-P1 TaxID=3037653 RepID=UPI00241FD01D|nr:aspartate aminotransferase family protein [Evansella sp. AB-P1]MDG5788592.1 aspartate aminotransferase family protein [Evansella sp. AB-P1]